MHTTQVFARDLAAHPTRTVALTTVVDLLAETHAPALVHAYECAMRAGARFPPISVVRVPGRLLVADGHKRLAAYRRLGVNDIVVEVWPWRRWWVDQGWQAVRHAGKIGRAVGVSLREPRELRHLFAVTTGHWRRVARSLASAASQRPDSTRHRH